MNHQSQRQPAGRLSQLPGSRDNTEYAYERAVLGAVLIQGSLLDSLEAMLRVRDFGHAKHRTIYQAMLRLKADGRGIDYLTVLAMVGRMIRENSTRRENEWVEVVETEVEDLIDCAEVTFSTGNLAEYANAVLENATRRDMLATVASAKNCNSHELATTIERAGKDAAARLAPQTSRSVKQHLADYLAELDDESRPQGIATGFKQLDAIIDGLQAENLIILAARPSHGKTSLANACAISAAVNARIPTAYFSLEVSGKKITSSMCSAIGQVDIRRIASKTASEAEMDRFTLAAQRLATAPLEIEDQQLTAKQIVGALRRMVSVRRVGLAIVDYLGLVPPDNRAYGVNREQEVADSINTFKRAAVELKIPMLLLVQLNREIERDGKKRSPRLSDLRESGRIEQDADVVMFIQRMCKVDPLASKTAAELHVVKNRLGPTGIAHLRFIEEFRRFEEAQHEERFDL